MYKLLCENARKENRIYSYLIENKNQLDFNSFYYNNFNYKDIIKILKRNKNKLNLNTMSVINFETIIFTEEDLIKMLEIMNESIDLRLLLDVTKCDLEHKKIIEIIKKHLNLNKQEVTKVKYQESSEAISYEEYCNMYNIINNTISEVKNLDLSPLEEVMYVFDIVKSKIYKDDSENLYNSRYLNNVIKTDYIVCVGYSNYMEFILKELGHNIDSVSFNYDNSKKGHRRNSIYLKDEKYDIDNLFFLDATSNSKKNEEDNNYINNYSTFLEPYRIFQLI